MSISMNVKRARDFESSVIVNNVNALELEKFQKSDFEFCSRRSEFRRHLRALNISIHDWFQAKINDSKASSTVCDMSKAAVDYNNYIIDLENRYLRHYGDVLMFGSGDCAQLGFGTESDDDMIVRFPRLLESLRYKKVVGISCGGLHNAIYTDDGKVYTWGCSDDGSLGREGDEAAACLVTGELLKQTIIGVSCGDGQTIALSASGEVYGWGCYKDKEGKKFFNPESTSLKPVKEIKNQKNTPIKISGLSNIVEIISGSSFCMARDSLGDVFSWGISECGELGRRVPNLKIKSSSDGEMVYDLDNILIYHLNPAKMHKIIGSNASNSTRPIANVKAIGCGSYHSFVITCVDDAVYSCGLNNYAQLGLGDTETKDVLTKVTCLSSKNIISITGGIHHSVCLSSEGKVYSFGRGDSGQLGNKEMEKSAAGAFSTTPLQVNIPNSNENKVIRMSCGGNHSFALTSKNDVYSWGYGDMLALGNGQEQDEFLPVKINLKKSKLGNIKVFQVAGGGQHSAIIGEVNS